MSANIHFVLNELVTRINFEEYEAKAKLEVEESGREVARLQGNISGYKRLLGWLAAGFSLQQSQLEFNGDTPLKLPELTDGALESLRSGVEEIKESAGWEKVQEKLSTNTEHLKRHLLFTAEKTRDLDLSQGEYTASVSYENLFTAIGTEVARREKERQRREEEEERRRVEPGLPFEGDE